MKKQTGRIRLSKETLFTLEAVKAGAADSDFDMCESSAPPCRGTNSGYCLNTGPGGSFRDVWELLV